MNKLQYDLEKFRIKYVSARCTVYDNMLVYSLGHPGKSFVEFAIKQAKELIDHLELDLIVTSGGKPYYDTFTIKDKNPPS